MADLSPYLFFDGNCAEAMRFYEKTLGGKLELMFHRDAPDAANVPAGNADRVMHAHLPFEGTALMASDTMAGEAYAGMKNVWLSLTYDAVDRSKQVFDALADGGKVIMPFEETFWTKGFGMVIDRFGTSWMLNVRSS